MTDEYFKSTIDVTADSADRIVNEICKINVTNENKGTALKVVMRPNENAVGCMNTTDSYKYAMYIYGFKLTHIYLESVELLSTRSTLRAGETATVNVTGLMTDGSNADLSKASIVYTNKTPDIVSFDPDTRTVSWLPLVCML